MLPDGGSDCLEWLRVHHSERCLSFPQPDSPVMDTSQIGTSVKIESIKKKSNHRKQSSSTGAQIKHEYLYNTWKEPQPHSCLVWFCFSGILTYKIFQSVKTFSLVYILCRSLIPQCCWILQSDWSGGVDSLSLTAQLQMVSAIIQLTGFYC